SARIEYGRSSAVGQNFSPQHNIACISGGDLIVSSSGKLLAYRLGHALFDPMGICNVIESRNSHGLPVPDVTFPGSQTVAATRKNDNQQREDQYPQDRKSVV